MFLVCDKTRSDRGKAIREKIFDAGYPCAFCEISEIADYLPVVDIITFMDVLYDVRRTPFNNIHVFVLGSGFVNSALNAHAIPPDKDLIAVLRNSLYRFFNVRLEWRGRMGVFYDDGVYMREKGFIIFGNPITPTKREYNIFKYLQVAAKLCDYVPAWRICRFCYPAKKMPKSEEEASRNLAVHIANLNRKTYKIMYCYLIEGKRFIGYRINRHI